MSRVSLFVLGLLVTVMGVLAVVPSLELADEPMWHAVVKIVVGAVAMILALLDRKKKSMSSEAPVA